MAVNCFRQSSIVKTMLALLFSLYRHYLSFWSGKIRVIKAIKIMYENRRDADEPQISKAATGRGY